MREEEEDGKKRRPTPRPQEGLKTTSSAGWSLWPRRQEPAWLVIDGYEDEPAAFGVPPYVGFHIRYLCGVLGASQDRRMSTQRSTHGGCTFVNMAKRLRTSA